MKIFKVIIAVVLCLFFHQVVIAQTTSFDKLDRVSKVGNKNIVFKNGKIFKTNLYDIDFIGELQSNKKSNFLILTGRQCQNCDANISIYIHSPSDGPLKEEFEQTRFGLPGQEFNYENNKLIYEARAFWGEVLPKRYGVLWFQKNLNDKNEWIDSIFIAELINDQIKSVLIKASLSDVLSQVKKKVAWEIEGRQITSEP